MIYTCRIILYYLWIGARSALPLRNPLLYFFQFQWRKTLVAVASSMLKRRHQHQFIVIVWSSLFLGCEFLPDYDVYDDSWSTNRGDWCGLCEELWGFSLTGDCDIDTVDTMAPSMAPHVFVRMCSHAGDMGLSGADLRVDFVQSKWFSDWNGFLLGMAGMDICGAC